LGSDEHAFPLDSDGDDLSDVEGGGRLASRWRFRDVSIPLTPVAG
jgi:hypothetical protein